jgi:hypothetical protein
LDKKLGNLKYLGVKLMNKFEDLKSKYQIIKKSFDRKPLTLNLLEEFKIRLEDLFNEYGLELFYRVSIDFIEKIFKLYPYDTITELVFYFLEINDEQTN